MGYLCLRKLFISPFPTRKCILISPSPVARGRCNLVWSFSLGMLNICPVAHYIWNRICSWTGPNTPNGSQLLFGYTVQICRWPVETNHNWQQPSERAGERADHICASVHICTLFPLNFLLATTTPILLSLNTISYQRQGLQSTCTEHPPNSEIRIN